MTNPVPLTKVLVGSHLKSALGMPVLPLSVMIVTASLPMGANVFMFAQRYEVAQDLVRASTAVSAVLALATIMLVMSLVGLMG
jgi:malonate transporter